MVLLVFFSFFSHYFIPTWNFYSASLLPRPYSSLKKAFPFEGALTLRYALISVVTLRFYAYLRITLTFETIQYLNYEARKIILIFFCLNDLSMNQMKFVDIGARSKNVCFSFISSNLQVFEFE